MKFSWKIFFVSFLIIVISFGAGGFALVNSVFTSTLHSHIDAARDNNRYLTSSFCAVLSDVDSSRYEDAYIQYIADNFSRQLSASISGSTVKIGKADSVSDFSTKDYALEIDVNSRSCRVVNDGSKSYIQVVSCISVGEQNYYIQTVTDITDIYTSRDGYILNYQLILMCVALGASLILFVLSRYLTRPLVKLSSVTREIADGDYSKRADISGAKEIKELSSSFNSMAQNVENYIAELKASAQSRDNFVADFTHELKTPLTSVIGYADILRSYELDAQQRRKCADYIYKEGKRLEALSANLLDIIVLKNSEVKLSKLKTDALFTDTGNAVEFLLKKYNIKLDVSFQTVYIMAEPSLIKTLLYNIIDNACKASKTGQLVTLVGCVSDGVYQITVTDSGRGIPKEELDKITQPFYMVDKSRSRSMGGAGLGLALCGEIAGLHGSELSIKSVFGKGTSVSFTVPLYTSEEVDADEH